VLRGATLAAALREYVGAINGGGVPTVARAWGAVRAVQARPGIRIP
jgi:hypothetical protein